MLASAPCVLCFWRGGQLAKTLVGVNFNIWPGHKYFGLMSKMKALAKTIEKDPESGQPLKRDGYKQVVIPSRMHLVAMQ